jgi:hypothetical protein
MVRLTKSHEQLVMRDLQATSREQLADWIETVLLLRGARQIGLDAIQALAEERVGASPAAVSLAIGVMSRRAQALGSAYPFTVIPDVALRGTDVVRRYPYAALLLMSPEAPSRTLRHPSPPPEMALLFEQMTVRAALRLLGEQQSKAVRFGWPYEDGRPPDFPGAVSWLASQMGIAPGAAYRPPRRRDGGVDVVAWRPFPDGRSGFPMILVQCTLQAEILAKAADIDLRIWAGWLTLDIDPWTALAVPMTIAKKVEWDDLAVRCLILERVRLAGLLGRDADAETADFIDSEIQALRVVMEYGR